MNRKILIILALVAMGIGWYLFRPERLFIATEANESFPTASPQNVSATAQPELLFQGTFHGVAHDAKGTASVFRLPDGKRVLRFTDFETSNGPDVNIYLVAAPDATDSDTVKNAGFVSLGPIKGTKGDQNYDIPEDVDFNKYQSVTVWCKRFSVNFATAPLSAQSMMQTSSAQPVALSEGTFHGVAHEAKGVATVYQLPDGKKILRFSDFETSNGPDVQVYLVAANDATDSETVKAAGFISLGPIKGTKGDQNYELPGNVDLDKYRSVTVWCKRFSVNFATAPLMQKTS